MIIGSVKMGHQRKCVLFLFLHQVLLGCLVPIEPARYWMYFCVTSSKQKHWSLCVRSQKSFNVQLNFLVFSEIFGALFSLCYFYDFYFLFFVLLLLLSGWAVAGAPRKRSALFFIQKEDERFVGCVSVWLLMCPSPCQRVCMCVCVHLQ